MAAAQNMTPVTRMATRGQQWRWLRAHEMADELERYDREHQNDCKENDRAILERSATRNFNAIQYPVGYKIKPDSCQCEIDNFHCVCAFRPIVTGFYRVVWPGN